MVIKVMEKGILLDINILNPFDTPIYYPSAGFSTAFSANEDNSSYYTYTFYCKNKQQDHR